MGHDSRARDIMEYSFLHVFANDRTIDSGELAFMERLALSDGMVDDAEREVLHNIFSRVTKEQVEPAVWDEILRFKAQHGIP